ncbi:hypothetical protein [Robiginitalea sp. SC105]|uniref:hypothetical protein n=1 Tax=Robiginitalea sp. SC105 TaxID=2762332 RepID=UPI0016397712|nr:hypothetical protein [Robiginitalea sp. SC105]MBC2838322.1 hypothetical protein [Robiginitalea sp. SC105]
MKRFLFISLLCFGLAGQAQIDYWTSYTFVVEPQNVSTVYNMVDTYYKAHKPNGVSVRLFENHFTDHTNNYTHALVFSGSLDAMGSMYKFEPNADFDLFLTQLNQHIKDGYSSSMGSGVAGFTGGDGPYPFRRMFLMDVDDPAAYAKAFTEFNSENNPNGRMIFLGSISAGRSPHGETHFIITGFKDFKTAMKGVSALVPEGQWADYQKRWEESIEAGGGVRMVSNSLRILLGEW